jgi:hypothetical protein
LPQCADLPDGSCAYPLFIGAHSPRMKGRPEEGLPPGAEQSARSALQYRVLFFPNRPGPVPARDIGRRSVAGGGLGWSTSDRNCLAAARRGGCQGVPGPLFPEHQDGCKSGSDLAQG